MAIDLSLIKPEMEYTTKEAAALLCKSMAWLERHRWAGTGPIYSKGKPVLYSGADLIAWMQAQKVRPRKTA